MKTDLAKYDRYKYYLFTFLYLVGYRSMLTFNWIWNEREGYAAVDLRISHLIIRIINILDENENERSV